MSTENVELNDLQPNGAPNVSNGGVKTSPSDGNEADTKDSLNQASDVGVTSTADPTLIADETSRASGSQRGSSVDKSVDEWDPNIPVPPDGGWGWCVVLASFLLHVIADGVMYSFGIFYVELVDYFNSGKGATAWIASLMVGITFLSGPLASAFVNRFGCRATTIAGSLVTAIGFGLSVFATSIYVLYFTIGITGGIGLGLMYLPAIVSVGQYFEKKRSFATGLAVCGSGAGTFAFAPLSKFLIDEFAWKGATLILAGILLNCIILGAMFRPLYSPNQLEEKKRKRLAKKQKQILDEAKKRKEAMAGAGNCDDQNAKKELLCSDTSAQPKQLTNFNTPHYSSLPTINPPAAVSGSNQLKIIPKSNPVTNSDTTIHHLVRRGVKSDTTPEHPHHQHHHHHHHPNMPMSTHSAYGLRSEQDLARLSLTVNPTLYVTSMMSMSMIHIPEEGKSKTGFAGLALEFKKACKQMTDLSLLMNPLFVLFAISNFFTSIGFNAPYIYLPDQAKLLGIEEHEAAFLISIIGIANTVGRVFFGWLSDRIGFYRLHLYSTALFLCGITTALSPFCVTQPWLAAYAASYGLFVGTYVTLTAILLVDLLGLEHLVNSFGLLLLFQGAATLIGPPMLGWVFDGTGTYFISFIIAGVMIGTSGAMLYVVPCIQKSMQKGAQEREASAQAAEV